MHFTAPAAFAWLALSVVIIVLHRLRPRPQQHVVPSLLLWQRVDTALASQRRWRRLLKTLLLVAHLALIALLTMALAGPLYRIPATAPYTAHIVDRSASMMAFDIAPNRLHHAVLGLADHVRSHPGPLIIIAVGATASVLYEGSDTGEAIAAANAISSQDAAPNWAAAADILQSLTPAPDVVTVWTDGVSDPAAFAPLSAAAGPRLLLQFVGNDSADNVAITAFDLQRRGAGMQAYDLLLAVENLGTETVYVPLRIDIDDAVIHTEAVTLTPGEKRRIITPIAGLTGEVIEARISPVAIDNSSSGGVDFLAADNYAAIVTRSPELSHVALVGGGHDSLQQGLRIFPHVRLQHKLLLSPNDRYHLAIHHGSLPSAVAGNHWVIPLPASDPQTHLSATVTWADPLHPITRHIDWDQVRIDHVQPIVADDARLLVDSDAGPLLTLESGPEGSVLRMGFSLEQSNLAGRVAFPILLSNVLQHFHPAGWDVIQQPLSAGTAYQISSGAGNDTVSVTGPDGSALPLHKTDTGVWVTPAVSGLHQVIYSDRSAPFVVQPSREASRLIRRLPPADPNAEFTAVRAMPTNYPLEPWLVAAALSLLFAETWLYTNRHTPRTGDRR